MTTLWHLSEITSSSVSHLEVRYEYFSAAAIGTAIGTKFSSIAGLPEKQLYPSVSAVYGNTEVSMVYLGPPMDG